MLQFYFHIAPLQAIAYTRSWLEQLVCVNIFAMFTTALSRAILLLFTAHHRVYHIFLFASCTWYVLCMRSRSNLNWHPGCILMRGVYFWFISQPKIDLDLFMIETAQVICSTCKIASQKSNKNIPSIKEKKFNLTKLSKWRSENISSSRLDKKKQQDK